MTETSRIGPHKPLRDATAVGWLCASIVHDFRNPVSAIHAAAEMLQGIEHAPTIVKRLAVNIHRATCRMRDMLAEFTSLGHENMTPTEDCNLRDLIVAATQAALAEVESHNVRIRIDVSSEIELPMVRQRMERVFVNLLTNSLEAMPSGGEVRIAARGATGCILVEVEDTGSGIPPAIRDRLFEPFVTAGKEDGLGLGLALSRRTVRDHGGDLWTEPASGARFVLRLRDG